MSRKHAFENQKHTLVNRESSPLSPEWMQRANNVLRPVDKIKEHVPISASKMNIRAPENRVLMHESRQPIIRNQL